VLNRKLNRAKKKEEETPAKPPVQEVLLGEIRDLFRTRS
jgi:large-conductance mechanosensitive channel